MAGSVKIIGLEASQGIQNLDNEIPLIEGKSGVVRLYVEARNLSEDTLVKGRLRIRSAGGRSHVIDSLASLRLRAGSQPGIGVQRRDLDESLNFYIAPGQLRQGEMRLELTALTPTMNGEAAPRIDAHRFLLPVQAGAPFRVRVVGLRVKDPKRNDAVDEPTPQCYRSLRALLQRALPASKIEWSQTTIAAPAGFAPPYPSEPSEWQFEHNLACAAVMRLRAREVGSGKVDHRTHYYAMVWHPSEFFIGAASNLPGAARTDIVAVGPATGDGLYGVHELGHVLGCMHPGGPGQQREDPDFPDSEGRISTEQGDHFGIDPGDGGNPPTLLPWTQCYDIMTYRDPQWISAYNYMKMMQRIAEVDALRAEPGDFLQVVGTYSPVDAQCRIMDVVPSRFRLSPRPRADSDVRLEGQDDAGNVLFSEAVEQKNARAIDLPQSSGSFQVSMPKSPKIKVLVLLVNERVVAQRTIAT